MMTLMSRLSSVKTLMRFNCACKRRWCSSIQKEDQYLIDSHFTRSKNNQLVDDTNKLLFISSTSDKNDRGRRKTFLFSYLLEGQIVKRCKLDLDYPHVKVLKPVNGLVCFCRYDNNSVLIFNPTTGDFTSWIESPTYNEELIKGRRKRASSYGFGYDPTTKEHKVTCIREIFQRTVHPTVLDFTSDVWGDDDPDEVIDYTAFDLDGLDKDEYEDVEVCRFCEVLTVGENRWRRIDEEVPPYQLSCHQYEGDTIGDTIYANGSIYWRFRGECDETEFLVAFDVGKEKFRVIPIPDFVIDPLEYKFSQTVELMELDGRIALVKWESEWLVTLWKFDDHNKENGTTSNDDSEWTKEESIRNIPTMWSGKQQLRIEAIAGTDLIFLCQYSFMYYYKRKKNIYEDVNITYDDIKGLRRIANFVESSLPVQKHHQHHNHTNQQPLQLVN